MTGVGLRGGIWWPRVALALCRSAGPRPGAPALGTRGPGWCVCALAVAVSRARLTHIPSGVGAQAKKGWGGGLPFTTKAKPECFH